MAFLSSQTLYIFLKHRIIRQLLNFCLGCVRRGEYEIFCDRCPKQGLKCPLDILSVFVLKCHTLTTCENPSVLSLFARVHKLRTMPTKDMTNLYSTDIYQQILDKGLLCDGTRKIILHLCWENLEFSNTIVEAICKGLQRNFMLEGYFYVLASIIALADSKHSIRVNKAMESYLKVLLSKWSCVCNLRLTKPFDLNYPIFV
eukprot:Phypoly_transcript_15166.p1 GENE.Phypoly_transcript_15166~~Phypoly_transcript_15166.p1  ORF type:complete len:234 (+),score=6.79 Phypoly_transcript_15166:100-702(+)